MAVCGGVAGVASLESLVRNRNRAERMGARGESMSRKEKSRNPSPADKPKMDWKALEVVHANAAGIDIGGSEHWVAISPERDQEPVRCFDCFTADVEQMADWLVERGVGSVAMQSTGVYWMPV